jgi:sugar transferase EpsL
MTKRLFDFFLACILLIICGIPMIIISIIIFISMGSPVLFRQKRPGQKGVPFIILKFRTMNESRDEKGNLLPDGQRMTFLGKYLRKFSLDELPQLLNVLKGDMSFIGPRPLLMEYLPLYTAKQARRHDVKPGITGWTQINGRNALTWEEKFELDLWYIDNQSFVLDMKIVWITLWKVIKREGISAKDSATMPKFEG